jgi:hypothetical protein
MNLCAGTSYIKNSGPLLGRSVSHPLRIVIRDLEKPEKRGVV